MKIRKIHIEKYKVLEDFDINFTKDEKASNLITIAGINGSGKTTLFEFIDKFINDGHFRIGFNNYIDYEEFDTNLNKLKIDKLIHTPTTIYTGYYDEKLSFDKPAIYIKVAKFDKGVTESIILEYINKLIYEEDIIGSKAYQKVQEVLDRIFDGFDLQIEFNKLDKKREVYFRNKYSDKIKLNELSTGEQELITRAFSLYIADLKEKIILIDEPETSLHPNWQNRILKVYEDFAIENNNQIIIATHSPHIIASAKKESLRLLVKRDDKIEVVSDFAGSYGYEVQRVLLEIMNLNSLRIPGVDDKIEKLNKLVHENKFDSDEFINLQKEMVNLLGKNDKDLMMQRLEIAKRRKENEKNK